jgi:hypothetical protein
VRVDAASTARRLSRGPFGGLSIGAPAFGTQPQAYSTVPAFPRPGPEEYSVRLIDDRGSETRDTRKGFRNLSPNSTPLFDLYFGASSYHPSAVSVCVCNESV